MKHVMEELIFFIFLYIYSENKTDDINYWFKPKESPTIIVMIGLLPKEFSH